ncbi:HdeD family acid-resistance protein [Siccirubricoccus sp. KC 17139]|uniref:HdeD family acid-resistance protein n=1 Tax=Siccirubricoccus soli TaxID=2899147 RepID=A0ABT1D3Q8_9PROT|nr:HdeD family acid-resistance protein [Siccirubricoccus soli]MCO6416553.1 HdeD family acid-resistance protein [Siccirubricoccus soli]MCP2682688.1 HdeD family acid-resistance protein [Siccirubricoccus soli]
MSVLSTAGKARGRHDALAAELRKDIMSISWSTSDLAALQAELRSRWEWVVALGVALFMLGILALGNLVLATLASVLFVGAMMVASAVAQAIHAFRVKGRRGFTFLAAQQPSLQGRGVVTFANPVLAVVMLTLTLAFALIASGVLRVWTGIGLRASPGWG